jgi:hypothetical protein
MEKAIWSTVSLVKDTPEAIQRFVSWHLAMGADHMHLFFDDPNDPSIAMLAPLDRVTATPCDGEFWTQLMGKPVLKRHGRRQNGATAFGYRQVQQGWVLNLDCDEFIYSPLKPVSDILRDQPDEVQVIRVRPAEEVCPGAPDGKELFRQPVSQDGLERVYGDFAPILAGRAGFVGHRDGKSFIRAGISGLKLRQHWPCASDGAPLCDLDIEASEAFALLHRNAEGYEQWRGKLPFRVDTVSMPRALRGHLAELMKQDDEAGIRKVYEQIFHLSPDGLDVMRQESALLELEAPLNQYVNQYFA